MHSNSFQEVKKEPKLNHQRRRRLQTSQSHDGSRCWFGAAAALKCCGVESVNCLLVSYFISQRITKNKKKYAGLSGHVENWKMSGIFSGEAFSLRPPEPGHYAKPLLDGWMAAARVTHTKQNSSLYR